MIKLKAKIRELCGKKTEKLRKKGLIPAVVYGHGFKQKSLEVSYLDFEKVLKQAGESSLIDLEIEGDKTPLRVLIHDLQRHPLTDKIQHIDFYRIKEGEKITVEIGIKLVGEAPAVKDLGGVLLHYLSTIKVECLPQDLIHEIEVDIGNLKNFDDVIRVKDLKISSKIRVLENPEEVIVQISKPKMEEEKPKIEAEKVLVEKTEEKIETKKEQSN